MAEESLEPRRARPAKEEPGDDVPEVGDWFWVPDSEEKWLGCITHVGTNHVQVKGPSTRYGSSTWGIRIHFDELDTLEPEPEAESIIQRRIKEYRGEVRRLLVEARQLTQRLSVGFALAAGVETEALALRGSGREVTEYKGDLIAARDKQLPEIFRAVERNNELAASWMGASLIPLKAQARGAKGLIEAIEHRIFNVELYAGLVEQVEQIADGEPAPPETPVHLMQRRAYMDEECLARYETGGMEFKHLRDFDKWMARPENRDRLLPHPRCVLAMRVRRQVKHREVRGLIDFITMFHEEQADKKTFLYMRNGQCLFRLSTGIEFGEKLFPDTGRNDTTKPLYFSTFAGTVSDGGFISEGEYEHLLDREREGDGGHGMGFQRAEYYHRYSPDSVYYDDATKVLHRQMAQHNRMVLVLQGILDRSPVFHPHPPWNLWEQDGFEAALRLVFDDSRAITPGEAPDFEAYRSRLNESLAPGSITVGQEDHWLRVEAERECRRRDRDWRDQGNFRPQRWHPYGDPGPGRVARVANRQPRARRCKFVWRRESRDFWSNSMVRRVVVVPDEELLNVDAYTPGDFRLFFDDPRTRALYLQWAPLLLEAEEYHAGNRKIRSEDE